MFGFHRPQLVAADPVIPGDEMTHLAIYTTTAGQTFTGVDKANFGTLNYDPNTLVTNAATNFNYVVPEAGTYGILFSMLWGPIAKAGYVELAALKNDLLDHVFAAHQLVNVNDYDGLGGKLGMLRGLVVSDTIAVRLYNQTTATLTATTFAGYNRLHIFRMGD
jgi:hypothetical protein